MKKRGQITVFLIIGIVILIIIGLFFYLAKYSVKSKSNQIVAENTKPVDTDIVKAYAESCLKMVSDDALFNRIGLQGGFINPAGDADYKERGIVGSTISPNTVDFAGVNVPYYLEATCTVICTKTVCVPGNCNPPSCTPALCGTPLSDECEDAVCGPPRFVCTEEKCKWTYKDYLPDSTKGMDLISQKLANYVEVEFKKCFNKNIFKSIDIGIEDQTLNPSVSVKINNKDVSVTIWYNLTVIGGSNENKLDSFKITLPIGLNEVYQSSLELVNNIKKITETDKMATLRYDILPDCPSYNKNRVTNVYFRPNDNGKKEIVDFKDYSTYFNNYFKTYSFDFALKNIEISGSCTGS